MASVLVRTLLETQQPVPEFLAQHVPEGEDLKQLKFESENEMGDAFGSEDVEGEGGGWGAPVGVDDTADETGAWGASPPEVSTSASGWGPPATGSGGW